jgi:hypothetical protein
MTYEELAELLDCTLADVHERIHRDDLDRKISRDGNKRAKLTTEMMGIFVERLQTNDQGTAHAIENLRYVHELMRERPKAPMRSRL